MATVQVNSRNIQKFSLLDYRLDIKYVMLFLSISILKVVTILMYAYFKGLLRLSRKMAQMLLGKRIRRPWFSKVKMSNLDDSSIFEDDSGVSSWAFGGDRWDSIKFDSEG